MSPEKSETLHELLKTATMNLHSKTHQIPNIYLKQA
jgi:hypothetical protein